MAHMIEDHLRPTTVNEVRLLDRIAELKLELWVAGGPSNLARSFDEVRSLEFPPPLELSLAAQVNSEVRGPFRQLAITGSAKGREDGQLAFAHYLPAEAMREWTPELAAEALGELHLRLIRRLAAQLGSRKAPA